MKKIFLICLSAGFISTGFGQSSVADVPENKIKPAYEAAETKAKSVSTPQKAVTPQAVLNNAGLNAHDQPNLKPVPSVTKPADKQPYADKTIPGTLLTPPAVHMGSADAPKAATEIQAPAAPAPVKKPLEAKPGS